MPGGCRAPDETFFALEGLGGCWSSTEASLTEGVIFGMLADDAKLTITNTVKSMGLSVRCIK